MGLPAGDKHLVQIMDAALAEARRKAGPWLACRPGCTQCCHGAFAISRLDAERLRAGMEELGKSDSSLATDLARRAAEWITANGAEFPGDLETGILGESAADKERFEEYANDPACPALNPVTGLCDIYAWRPMTCRIFGPPVRVGEGDALGCCELCFVGASEAEIAACEMPLPHALEASLRSEIAAEGATLVVFALRDSGSHLASTSFHAVDWSLNPSMPMRPCWAEIRTRAFEDNFRFLASLATPHAELLAIVKADAYGHSLALCAPAAVRAGARWLGVTSVEEGVAARALCPETRILVIGGIFPGQAEALVANRLTAVVWEPWHFDEIEKAARLASGDVPVHLEIDTGMSRQGVPPAALSKALARFHAASPLRLEGVMTHLFASDEADGEYTRRQLAILDKAMEQVSAAGLWAEWLSVGASAALLAGEAETISALAARHGSRALLRPGLVLYGLAPAYDPAFAPDDPPSLKAAHERLQPVLSWKTRVTSVRSIPAGAVVGYNGTFVATEPMRLALLAAGYADGIRRSLGNRFSFLVRGARAPLVGRVSMDQSIVDVTDIPGVAPGDEVVLLGSQGSETISAFDHAAAAGTIPWEILTGIGARVRRIAV